MNLRSLTPSNDRASVPAIGGDPFEAMRREMDRLFDRLAAGTGTGLAPWSFAGGPALDVAETDGSVDVAIELPGVDENDVEVSVAGDLLTISGEKRDEREEHADGHRRVERSFGRFRRTVQLPFDASEQDVQARFDRGVPTGQGLRAHRPTVRPGPRRSSEPPTPRRPAVHLLHQR